LTVADAYFVARAQNALARIDTTPDRRVTHCPNFCREHYPSIDCCHWCTADLSHLEIESAEAPRADDESE
jgi:hypothetical protein